MVSEWRNALILKRSHHLGGTFVLLVSGAGLSGRASDSIGFVLNGLTLAKKVVEGLDLVEKQAVIDHVFGSQRRAPPMRGLPGLVEALQ